MPSFGSLAYTPYVYPINFVIRPIRRLLSLPEYTWLLFHTLATGFGMFLLAARPRCARVRRHPGRRSHDVDAEPGRDRC